MFIILPSDIGLNQSDKEILFKSGSKVSKLLRFTCANYFPENNAD